MSDKDEAEKTAKATMGDVLKLTVQTAVETQSRLLALETVTMVAIHHICRNDTGLLAVLQQMRITDDMVAEVSARPEDAERLRRNIQRLVSIAAGVPAK